jgi:hypothetical protein
MSRAQKRLIFWLGLLIGGQAIINICVTTFS